MFAAPSRDLLAVVLTTVAVYATTLVLVRIAGRRTVSQMSAFDALITIAVGGIFATTVVSSPPSYGKGVVAIATLLMLQVVIGFVRQRSRRIRRLLDFSQKTVWENGELCIDPNPLGAQLISDDVDAAIRSAGYDDQTEVAIVVLESTGSFSVLPRGRR